MNLGLAWDISDTFNGLTSIPNHIGALTLSGTVFARRRIKKDDTNAVPMISAYSDIQAEQQEKLIAEYNSEK